MKNVSSVKNQDTWHAIAHIYDVLIASEYGHIAADCPDKIPPSGTLAHHKKHHSHMRHHTRSTSRQHHRDRHRFSRSRSQSHTHRYQSHSHNNSHRSCSRSYHRWPQRSTLHAINTQVLIVINATYHTEGHHHIEVSPLIPEITADLDHVLHTDPVEWHLLNLYPVLTNQHQNIRIGNIKESPLMTSSLTTTVQMMHPVIPMMI